MQDKIGSVRPGYMADLIVVNGNPLENMKVLYPALARAKYGRGVDDQRRLRLSRADAGERSARDGGEGAGGGRDKSTQ